VLEQYKRESIISHCKESYLLGVDDDKKDIGSIGVRFVDDFGDMFSHGVECTA